ncbi:hypothetical protein HDV57DRAFT_503249 [Trichoderma longibrachiatum]
MRARSATSINASPSVWGLRLKRATLLCIHPSSMLQALYLPPPSKSQTSSNILAAAMILPVCTCSSRRPAVEPCSQAGLSGKAGMSPASPLKNDQGISSRWKPDPDRERIKAVVLLHDGCGLGLDDGLSANALHDRTSSRPPRTRHGGIKC